MKILSTKDSYNYNQDKIVIRSIFRLPALHIYIEHIDVTEFKSRI